MVFAGGNGSRFDRSGLPKQFREIQGTPVLFHTIIQISKMACVKNINLIVPRGYLTFCEDQISQLELRAKVGSISAGGSTSHESKLIGLEAAINGGYEKILFHDGVRPLIDSRDFKESFDLLHNNNRAVASLTQITSTPLLFSEGDQAPKVIDRDKIFLGSSPQGITSEIGDILIRNTRDTNPPPLDVISACIEIGINVRFRNLHGPDFKLTHPSDWLVLERLINLGRL